MSYKFRVALLSPPIQRGFFTASTKGSGTLKSQTSPSALHTGVLISNRGLMSMDKLERVRHPPDRPQQQQLRPFSWQCGRVQSTGASQDDWLGHPNTSSTSNTLEEK